MSEKHILIHPTKTGGTVVELFFKKNYSKYIQDGWGHEKRCADVERPITIFRDPYDRFSSMFRYWKFGSERYKLEKKKLNERSCFNINDFAGFIKNNKTEMLYNEWLWDVHFKPQSYWYNCDYNKIIVIEYCDNLHNSVYKLLSFLGIENKNIELGIVNKTCKEKNNFKLNNENIQWFKEYFKEDLNISSQIKKNSHNFKLLIRCD